jgi:hypothetical protein
MFTTSFFDPLYPSYQLVKKLSKIGNIDNSHNHNHAKEVLFWSTEIIKQLPFSLSRDEILMIGQCSLLHDLIDPKYTDFSIEVETHLKKYHSTRDVYFMMKIMNTMSYSKIVSPQGIIHYPKWVSNSPYLNTFHITREADLLSSYNIARMIEYRENMGTYTDNEIKKEVIELYHNRMDKLISRQLFYFDTTIEIAKSLEQIGKLKLQLVSYINIHKNLDILRFINYLSIHDLISKFDSLD